MKYFFLLFLCFTCLTASAQWWRVGPLKKKRREHIANVKTYSFQQKNLGSLAPVMGRPLKAFTIDSYYNLYRAEASIMKKAQRNMRFRVYDQASYDFSELAKVYVKLHRLSEAKWYLLQSNLLARRQNDQWHVYFNLLKLAEVKVDMGDISLARRDLTEARELAGSRGWRAETLEVEKRLQNIPNADRVEPKQALKYAEVEPEDTKSK